MKYHLPTTVQFVLDRLLSRGHEAYAVGGCVRDLLLGQTPHDWDVCTSAVPEKVIEAFDDARVALTGLSHGTVTVICDHVPVEVTTYRVDGAYTDHRRPDSVRFTPSLREDLARRDFTINAMAYRPDTGVIDEFSGQADLRAGLVRCVGMPSVRFEEDALRILRALRFASRVGFSIEESTADAMLSHCGLLCHVAAERVLSELRRICFGRIDPRYLAVLRAVIPELQALRVPPELPEAEEMQLAALLRGLDADAILRRLKAPTALRGRVALLAQRQDIWVFPDAPSVRRLLRLAGPEAAEQILILQGNGKALAAMKEALLRGDCYTLRDLAVQGDDLLALGFAGREVGRMLETLLDKVMEGSLENDREALLRELKAR